MFPLFSFIVLFLSYVTAVCFLSRFPTLFRQISLTLTLFFPNSFAFLSLFLFLMSLLSYCLSFVHCISSILPDFVCFLFRSLSFSCSMFPLFSYIVLFLSYVTVECFLSRFPTLFRQFSLTLTLILPTSIAFLSLLHFLTSVVSFRYLSQSFFLLLTFLLSYCLSLVHCISSILFDFVCSVCCSLSFSL